VVVYTLRELLHELYIRFVFDFFVYLTQSEMRVVLKMSLLRDKNSTRARVEARQKAAEMRTKNQDWLQMLSDAGVNRRFAVEMRNDYHLFPTVEELESAWDTEAGQKIREHFGIESLRNADAFKEFGLDPGSAAKMLEALKAGKEFVPM
jgi:hypothetical protein